MKEFTDDVKSGGVVLGDTLEMALELGEKHEAYVTKCKTVSFCSPILYFMLSLSLSLQTIDDHMKKIHEDAQVLINPNFASDEEGRMHSATQQAIDSVKDQVEELRKKHKELIDFCQQRRGLFIVSVKFHMTTRQVSCVCCYICALLLHVFQQQSCMLYIAGNFGNH